MILLWHGVWNLNRVMVGPVLFTNWGFRGTTFNPPTPPPTTESWVGVTLRAATRRGGA